MNGLKVDDVAVTYPGKPPVQAVVSARLEVAHGEVVALVGPSGCGKSTLLAAIAGIVPLDRGAVTWDGEDVAPVPVDKRGFGLVFQDGQLFPHRDVAANVRFGLDMRGDAREAADARVAQLLALVGLPDHGARRVDMLSGGERQRVALARALAPQPRLLLLDEPLSSLDHELRVRLADDLRDILAATDTTAIIVTHDRSEAARVAGRSVEMAAGVVPR